jgi:hypothetical protein
MRFLLIASCCHTFHRAMRLCFRGFDAMMLMTSGASPIAQMSGAVVEGPSLIAAKNIHVGGDGRGALLARTKRVGGTFGVSHSKISARQGCVAHLRATRKTCQRATVRGCR